MAMTSYYRTSLADPHTRKMYSRFKKARGIPRWFPLSDQEREEFDEKYLQYQKEIEERKEKNTR